MFKISVWTSRYEDGTDMVHGSDIVEAGLLTSAVSKAKDMIHKYKAAQWAQIDRNTIGEYPYYLVTRSRVISKKQDIETFLDVDAPGAMPMNERHKLGKVYKYNKE